MNPNQPSRSVTIPLLPTERDTLPPYPGYAPPAPCSCSIPEDGTWIHLTVENTVCPKVEGRKVKFALTPMQLSDLKHKIEAALTAAGW